MNTLQQIKDAKQKKMDELIQTCKVFFAFSNEQFQENKTPLEPGEKYVSMGMGGYLPKSNVTAWLQGIKDIDKGFKSEMKKSKELRRENIAYELSNHEAYYTWEIEDTLSALGSGYTGFAVYISDTYKSNAKPEIFELILHHDSLAKIAAIKPAGKTIKIELIDKDQIIVEGQTINLFTGNYPDYNAVIPSYKKKVDFKKDELIKAIESVKPAANKATSQINFYIDENIGLHAQDVDFATESYKELNYVKSSLPKMEIALNGDMLLKYLKSFKSDEISLYSAGKSDKIAIFTDGLELACLMPLKMN